MIDFRSDTVTKPSKEMKEFMFSAPVGDDVFEEDPTINELEAYAAQMFGHEAALYCSSGTQTNQIAINVHCKPGDELICAKDAHIYKYEGGGIAKNSGTSVRLLEGDRGRISAAEVENNFNDPDNVHYPLTTLIAVEDTMNRGGGAIYDFEELKKVKVIAKKLGIPLHNDGARVFNALVENGVNYKTYGGIFDSISVCLSKGLGAPVGSVLIGSKDFIQKARRVRKVMGGGMRQAGIIAAGGLYALKNNINRLQEDHAHAKMLADAFQQKDWIDHVIEVQTNIVVVALKKPELVNRFMQYLEQNNVLAMPFGGNTIRMVTHLDISKSDIEQVLEMIYDFK
jgi:threonine aldolase